MSGSSKDYAGTTSGGQQLTNMSLEDNYKNGSDGHLSFLNSDNLGGAYKYMQKQAQEMAEYQRKAYKQAAGTLGNYYGQAIGFQQPYYNQGIAANDLMAAYSGALGPEAQREAYANYEMSPGVQFAMQQGMKGIDQNAAANQQLLGGNRLQQLQQYGTGIAMQDFGNQFNRLAGMSQQGQGAAGVMSGAAMDTGQGIAGYQAGIGDARAGAQGLAGQNWFQGWGGVNDTYSSIMGSMPFGAMG